VSQIILCCGKVLSGKSTFASGLQVKSGFIWFSADEWMLHFYGEPENRQDFEEKLSRCKEMIYRCADRFLGLGVNVVLDFGFWKIGERKSARSRFEETGHAVEIVYFPVSFEQQCARGQHRDAGATSKEFVMFKEKIVALNALFDEPEVDERVIDNVVFVAPNQV